MLRRSDPRPVSFRNLTGTADPNSTSAADDRYFPNPHHVPGGATLPLLPVGGSPTGGSLLPPPVLPVHERTIPPRRRRSPAGPWGSCIGGSDTAFGREVAVKLLLDSHLDKPELRRRFVEEARITARLQHPGIVPVYEVGEFPSGRPFYVMRLVRRTHPG